MLALNDRWEVHFILKLYVKKFKRAFRSIKAAVTPARLWNANAFNFTAGERLQEKSLTGLDDGARVSKSKTLSSKLKPFDHAVQTLVGNTVHSSHFWVQTCMTPEEKTTSSISLIAGGVFFFFLEDPFSISSRTCCLLFTGLNCCLHRPSPVSPQKRKKWQMFLQVRVIPSNNEHNGGYKTLPAARVQGDSVPLAFPHPFNMFAWAVYLFIYLFASMWSKRLMKQQAVCHLCRNNYMEMVFTGHCVAPVQPVLNWRQWSDWQRRE